MGRLSPKTLELMLLRTGLNWVYQLSYYLGLSKKRQVTFATKRSATLTDNLKALHADFLAAGESDVNVLWFRYDRTLQSKFGFLLGALMAL